MLVSARAHYLGAFRLDMSAVWALVQRLALDVALSEPLDVDQWITARGLALFALNEGGPRDVVGAHSALAELYVLAQVLSPTHEARVNAAARASAHIDALLGRASARLVRRVLGPPSAHALRDVVVEGRSGAARPPRRAGEQARRGGRAGAR